MKTGAKRNFSVTSILFGFACYMLTANALAYRLYWTPWVSEEKGGPPTYCSSWNEGAVGFACRGKYCDDVRLLCETFPYNITLTHLTNGWTSYFSEEDSGIGSWVSHGWYPYDGDNYKVCRRTNTGGVVQGIRCKGGYCDDISLECSVPIRWVGGAQDPASMTNCAWSGWYSEEQGHVDFGWNRYITGVECSGSYCDRKRFYVCSVAP